MKKLLIFCILLNTACHSGGPINRPITILNPTRDTTIRLTKAKGSLSPRIYLCAIGSLNDSSSVTLKNPRQPEKLYWRTWGLPKGRLDSLKQSFDYYDYDVDVVYSHGNVSQGTLQLVVRY